MTSASVTAGPERAVALALAAANGDQEACGLLYNELADKLWQRVRRHAPDATTADEVTGDVWLMVVQSIGSYDPTRGSVLSWLTKIAMNRLEDHRRTHTRRRTKETLAANLVCGEVSEDRAAAARRGSLDTTYDRASRHDRHSELRDVLAGLTDRCRDAILLTVFDGLSNAEAAKDLGCSEGAVKLARYRGLCALRAQGSMIAELFQETGTSVVQTVGTGSAREPGLRRA